MGFSRINTNYNFKFKIPKKGKAANFKLVQSFVFEPASSSHKAINSNSVRNIYGVGGNSEELSFFTFFNEEDSIEDDNDRLFLWVNWY